MSQFFRYIFLVLIFTTCTDVFAATQTSILGGFSGAISTGTLSVLPLENINTETTASGETYTGTTTLESTAAKKEKEQTINDINTFLIESYKLKIDKILSNLNLSLERITNNDPIAQAQLLEKIRNDIDTKIQIINSRSISENRKKILSSVFLYIQENLSAKISKLVREK